MCDRDRSEHIGNDMIAYIWTHHASAKELCLLGMPTMLPLIANKMYGGVSWHIHSDNASLRHKNE